MGNKNTLSEEKAKILDRRLTQKFNIIYLSIWTSKICQLTFLKLFTSTEHVKESNGFHAMIYNNTINTIGSELDQFQDTQWKLQFVDLIWILLTTLDA